MARLFKSAAGMGQLSSRYARLGLAHTGDLQNRRYTNDTMTQSGTWALRGVDLVLSDVLTEFNGWRPAQQAWRIIDRSNAPKGFAILGGGNDPDQWVVFEANRELSDAADSR